MAHYAITISPRLNPYQSPLFIHNGNVPIIRKYLNKFSNHYCLYPEFDDNNRLHYHGIIIIKDMIKYRHLKWRIDATLGYTKITKFKTFKDRLRYLVYSMKQWPENKDYFEEPVTYMSLRKRKRIIQESQDNKINILDYFG